MFLPDSCSSNLFEVLGNGELKQILDRAGTVEEHFAVPIRLFSDVIAKLLAFRVRSSERETLY